LLLKEFVARSNYPAAFQKKAVMQVNEDPEVPEEAKIIPIQPTLNKDDFEEKLLKVQKDLIDFLKEEGE
jgi:hypothetical protein